MTTLVEICKTFQYPQQFLLRFTFQKVSKDSDETAVAKMNGEKL